MSRRNAAASGGYFLPRKLIAKRPLRLPNADNKNSHGPGTEIRLHRIGRPVRKVSARPRPSPVPQKSGPGATASGCAAAPQHHFSTNATAGSAASGGLCRHLRTRRLLAGYQFGTSYVVEFSRLRCPGVSGPETRQIRLLPSKAFFDLAMACPLSPSWLQRSVGTMRSTSPTGHAPSGGHPLSGAIQGRGDDRFLPGLQRPSILVLTILALSGGGFSPPSSPEP